MYKKKKKKKKKKQLFPSLSSIDESIGINTFLSIKKVFLTDDNQKFNKRNKDLNDQINVKL